MANAEIYNVNFDKVEERRDETDFCSVRVALISRIIAQVQLSGEGQS